MFRRTPPRRRVRIQLDKGPTFEGIQEGRGAIDGHYLLITATVIERAADGALTEVVLDNPAEIRAERVIFLEVLSS